MPTTPLDGRPLSQTNRVNDLRETDLVPLVRPSEPLPEDQNAVIPAGRLAEILGATPGTVPPAPAYTLYGAPGTHTDGPMHQAATTAALAVKADLITGRVPSLQLQGTYRGNWAANTAYAKNDIVLNTAQNYYARADFTSGSTFNAANWNAFAPAGVNRLLNFTNEVLNPPTFDTGNPNQNFQCANNTNYLLTTGGATDMYLPTLVNTGFFVGIRLGVAATAPLALTALGDGLAPDYALTIQPGEVVVLVYLKPNNVVANSNTGGGQWLLAFRSMPPGSGSFDLAAFIASIDTAASNVSASISPTTGKLVLTTGTTPPATESVTITNVQAS